MATCEDKKNDGKLEVANLKGITTVVFDKPWEIVGSSTSEDLKGNVLPKQYKLDVSERALALGRKLIVLDKTIYGPSLDTIKKQSIISSDTVDNFRLNSLRYWTTDLDKNTVIFLKGEKIKHKVNNYHLIPDEQVNKTTEYRQYISISPNGVFFLVPGVKNNVTSPTPPISKDLQRHLGITAPVITVASKNGNVSTPVAATLQSSVYSPSLWKLYIEGGVGSNGVSYPPLLKTNVIYTDYAFQLNVPFFHEDIKEQGLFMKPLMYDIDFNYNYYVKEYEKNIVSLSERDLPNFYIFESEMDKEQTTELSKMITLGGIMDIKEASLSMPSKVATARSANSSYFGSYALKASRARQKQEEQNAVRESIQYVNDRHFNLIVPMDNVQILEKYYNKKVMFPMYVDLSFSTDRTTVVSNILSDCRLDKTFIKNIIFGETASSKQFVEDLETSIQEKTDQGSSVLTKGSNASINNRRTWDITDWLDSIDEGMLSDKVLKNGTILYNDTSSSNEDNTKIMRNLLRVVFAGKLKKLIKSKYRSFEDIMDGKLAYSETILYRIEKRLADNQGNAIGDVIQNFYVSNSNLIDTLKFIDIQVKYNTRYRYDIFAFQLVIGNKYMYTNLEATDTDAVIGLRYAPSILVVEVPYFSHANIVLDSPPVRPDVEIVPYKDIDNQILLLFNGNVGEYKEMPIAITEEDRKKIAEYRAIKKIPSDKPFTFRSDDHASIYQIYRTTEEPKDYFDFANKLMIAVQTDVSPLTAQSATSAAYKDKIKPNTKYWYMFRSVDNHGHLSQPSNVFQVEMVNNHGTIYPIVQDYEFKRQQNKKPSKLMRRYLYIAPTMMQSLIDEEKSKIVGLESAKDVDVNKVSLGLEDVGVWNKTYKIRITSKKTGKKIDINVTPKYQGIRKE